MTQTNADGTPFKPGQLFDPTLENTGIANLTNIPGQSLGATNTPAQIAAITPGSLTTTNPLAITNPNPPPIPNPATITPPLTITSQEQQQSDLTKTIQSENTALAGKSAFQTEQNTLAGVDTQQANINDLNAQLTSIKNEAAAIPVQEQSRAAQGTILTGGLQADQNQRLRDNAVKALGVSTLLAASQGLLANAQALADKAVETKFGPMEAQNKADIANLQLIANDPATTLADKNRAQAQLDIKTANEAKIAQDKADTADIWNIATTAATNRANFTATATYPNITSALNAIQTATTKEKALQIAVDTGLVSAPKVNNTQVVEVGGNKVLIDSSTGKTIKVLGSTSAGGGTQGGLAPDVASVSSFLVGKTPTEISAFNSLSDVDKSSAMQLINGDVLLADLFSSRGVQGSADRQAFLNKVRAIDPTFSENTNKQRYSFKQTKWNNGKLFDNRTSINTALGHMATLYESSKTLSKTNFPTINEAVNWAKKNAGNPALVNFQYDLTVLASEIASAYKGGTAPTDQETEKIYNALSSSFTPTQFQNVLSQSTKLMASKLSSLAQEYKNVMGSYPEESVIQPNVLQELKNAQIDTSKIDEILKNQGYGGSDNNYNGVDLPSGNLPTYNNIKLPN
jgi:hypothetical protein